MSRIRIACLFVPDFPLAARIRSEPEIRGRAFAVVASEGSSSRLLAVSHEAARRGVPAGATLAQARAIWPGLLFRRRSVQAEQAAMKALIETAEELSPRVEVAEHGTLFLDLSGGGDERTWISRMLHRAEQVSLFPRIGIGDGKLVARVAAEQSREEPVIVRSGQEREFLDPLPLALLHPDPRLHETLARWGLRTIGDLARLPASRVLAHLGKEGKKLHERARGGDAEPLSARPREPDFSEGVDTDWPLTRLEPFLFIAERLLERLFVRLSARGLAVQRMELALAREPRGAESRRLETAAPTRETRTWLELFRQEMTLRPPSAPITGIVLKARPDSPRRAQLALFGPASISPDRLATTLARLSSEIGPDRMGSPRSRDGHRPDRFDLSRFSPPPAAEQPPGPGTTGAPAARVAVRAIRPGVELEVLLDDAFRPVSLSSRSSGRDREIRGKVLLASGPWKVEQDWWCERKIEREYWDVELSDGGIYRIFLDLRDRSWHADGMYD